MNATELQQLLDDIALERSILDAAIGMKGLDGSSIDLRGPNVSVGLSVMDSFGGQAVSSFVERIMLPVLFGSAWKIVDLVIERAWQANGGGSRLSIKDKAQHALATFRAELTPLLGGDIEVAERIAILYGKSYELRHSLIHRRIVRKPNGDLCMPGGDYLTKKELEAFCKFSLQLAVCLEHGYEPRLRSPLAWWLNSLARVHQLLALRDAYGPRPFDTVHVEAIADGGAWFVDTERAHATAQRVNGGFPYAELRVHAPNGEFLPITSKLESVPRGARVRFDPLGVARWP